MNRQKTRQKPDWLKIKIPSGKAYLEVKKIVERLNLHTICTSGKCPNMCDCWGRGTATMMILGDICTRSCKFCAVSSGKPEPPDYNEPQRLADSIRLMGLKHCVLTSVDRDDLKDGGSEIWADTIITIKKLMPETTIEALIPDFRGIAESIDLVINAGADVISHNLETVRRITPQLRSVADYTTSLNVIKRVSDSGVRSKSGIMVGLGETESEIFQTMDDLLAVGCKVFTIGQYLQPTQQHLPVIEFVSPEKFELYKKRGLKRGFEFVESGPLVRSSFHAERHIRGNSK